MEWFLILIAVVVIFLFLLKEKGTHTTEYPYELQEKLVSPAERSFLGVLDKATEGKSVVFAKVRMADVLKPIKGLGKSNWQKAFNKISAKHFDFVLCNPDDLSVIAVVELDDKSHNKRKRISRDSFIEKACQTAGLPLHRFIVSNSYSLSDIRLKLFPEENDNVKKQEPDEILETEGNESDIKKCPKCESKLVKKTAKKGKHQGKHFLACSSYPKCHYLEEIKIV